MTSIPDPTQRFSDRVDDYVRYRPSYPVDVVRCLESEVGLNSDWVVADLGSGTGLLSRLFLENGNEVIGVEPNEPMRLAGEAELADFPRFMSKGGRAEQIPLETASVNLVVAGQAFHWFDPESTRAECLRVLRDGGVAALVWNSRRVTGSAFAEDYEAFLLEFGLGYPVAQREGESGNGFALFFGANGFESRKFFNFQEFDFAGLRGRLASSSYAPQPSHPTYPSMVEALRSIFDRYQQGGLIRMEYDTDLLWTRLE